MPGHGVYRRVLTVVICAIMLAACASEPAYPPRTQATRTAPALPQNPAARLAASLVGTPYRYGGSTPRGFDCSGLVYYTYRKTGVRIPRSTRSQYRHAVHIPRRDLQPGDLVFFKTDRHEVSHVGIYAGNDYFIHAPSRGKQVSFASLDDGYWRTHFVAAGRYF